ncbi:small secreted hydrophilic protein [Amycolatopsis antarctica]|uniref:Small secreted hydrophilic protein n=1 Tax=Amycolatopsis antarctica TaxID=1854586 RepID=A0A263D930_9PSEU|nr:hypothetical protein [Amycolatopsis antarctica]OZM74518.1 small secreted hydrophilic protein [Amycolatopsis antarctica]
MAESTPTRWPRILALVAVAALPVAAGVAMLVATGPEPPRQPAQVTVGELRPGDPVNSPTQSPVPSPTPPVPSEQATQLPPPPPVDDDDDDGPDDDGIDGPDDDDG